MFRRRSDKKKHPDMRVLFDAKWYARRHQLRGEDVAWQHFCEHRMEHRLEPNPLFDSRWYQAACNGPAPIDPLDHFLKSKPASAPSPSPFFEIDWYLDNNADVRKAGIDPYWHYVEWGRHEGRLPNHWCDPDYTGDPTFDLDLPAAYAGDDLLDYIPYHTTLTRLISGAEAAAVFSPQTPFWIFAKMTAPEERAVLSRSAVLLGGTDEQFSGDGIHFSGPNLLQTGSYRAFRVRYAVSPRIMNALPMLGRDIGSLEGRGWGSDEIAQAVALRPDVPLSTINIVVDTKFAPLLRQHLADGPLAATNVVTLDPGYLCRAQLL